jgi:hypothetical protein
MTVQGSVRVREIARSKLGSSDRNSKLKLDIPPGSPAKSQEQNEKNFLQFN